MICDALICISDLIAGLLMGFAIGVLVMVMVIYPKINQKQIQIEMLKRKRCRR